MKFHKQIASFAVALLLVVGAASASPRSVEFYDVGSDMNMVQLYASKYLDTYGVSLISKGDGRMCVSYAVCGTRTMDKIGVNKILIEEWDGDEWVKYGTVSGSSHSDFYAYDEAEHVGSYYFSGIVGVKYRATLTVYAELDGGSDTGTVSSYTCYC